MKRFNKLFISLVSIVLALCVTLSVGFACNPGESKGGAEEIAFEGTHIYNKTITSKEFIKNGKTNYRLIVPENPTENESLAKAEFTKFWEKATGYQIGVARDTDLTHAKGQKYISLGNTSLLRTSGMLEIPEGDTPYDVLYKTLEYDGVRIKTIDDNIYMIGGSDFGTVYSSYVMLELLFNFDTYYIDCFELDTVKNMNFPELDVTDIPDIAFRGGSVAYQRLYKSVTTGDEELKLTGWRQRLPYGYWHTQQGTPTYKSGQQDPRGENVLSGIAGGVHNDMEVLPPTVYKGEHPSWFSSGGDICFTCGNATPKAGETKEQAIAREFEALCQEIAYRLFQSAVYQNGADKGTPMKRYLMFTMEDATAACNCAACQANAKKYGAFSSNLILAANRIRDILYDEIFAVEKAKCEADPNYGWIFKEYDGSGDTKYRYEDYFREDFSLQFFAYAWAGDAPAVQDSTGKWVPTYPEMQLKENITPWVAISAANTRDFYSPNNDRWRNRLYGWDAISTDGYIHWGYATSFANAALPYNTYQVYTPEHYKLLAKTNCKHSFEETMFGGSNKAITSFGQLFAYIDSKLQWNCNLDFNTLVKKYFKAMYQDAADIMYNLYISEKDYSAYIWNTDPSMSTGSNSAKAKFWPLGVAKTWIKYIDEALAAVEHLKDTDPVLYQSTVNHIDTEWCSPAYIMLSLHSAQLTQQESDALKVKLKDVIARTGINSLGNSASATWSAFLNSFSD